MLNTLIKSLTSFLLLLTIGLANSANTAPDPALVEKYIKNLDGQSDVDLRNQKIGDKEAEALAEALILNKTLRRLNLDFNNIGEEGAAALAKALSFNNILSELYLERNNIKPDDATKEHSRVGKNGQTITYTFRDELEKNKKIAKMLKHDPQAIAFLIATGGKYDSDFWLPKEVALKIAATKAAMSAQDFDLGQFVTIQGGTYDIGSPENQPGHQPNEKFHSVELSLYFIMDAAVTQESYARIMGDNPSQFKDPKDCPLSFKEIEVNDKKIAICADFPVEKVRWDDANKFAALLSKQDGKYKYSLPTEAQLEVAFRGGTNTAYVTGRNDEAGLGDYVWYSANSGNQTHPVRSTQKNAYGVYRGSVWEWPHDRYSKDYAGSYGLDPKGPDEGSLRVLRGGSWRSGARYCRSAARNDGMPAYRGYDLGFRLVRT